MSSNTECTDYDFFYEKFSNDLVEEFFENIFANVTKKSQEIRDEQKCIADRVDRCNQKIIEKDNFKENYKKCVNYFEKALNIKRDLIMINEKCINLKKRAIELREDRELSKTKLILEKEKIKEQEQKLIPKINPQILSTTQTEVSSSSSSLEVNEPVLVTSSKIHRKNRRKPNTINPGHEITQNENKNNPN